MTNIVIDNGCQSWHTTATPHAKEYPMGKADIVKLALLALAIVVAIKVERRLPG